MCYPGPHPLDPLTEDEVRRAAAACRAHAAVLGLPPLRFNNISLQEPPKRQLLQYESGALQQLPRLSLCILQTPPHFLVYEATVDLQPQQHSTGAAAAVVSWTKVSPAVDRSAGSQPSHNPDPSVAPACLHLCAATQHAPPAVCAPLAWSAACAHIFSCASALRTRLRLRVHSLKGLMASPSPPLTTA